MKIISLQVENLKRLVAVEIRPDSNVVQITGRNAQGKTSVLDSIWWALAGTRNVQAVPIRKGAERASIKVDMGELKVTRTFILQEDQTFTTSLIVENETGSRFQKPQDVLNAVIGALSFDPLAFTRMAPKEQFDMLRTFVPGVDFAELKRLQDQDFTERADWNRKAKDLRAQADGITLPPGKTPKPVDLAKLEKELGDAATHNADVERRRSARQQGQDRLEAIGAEIARLTAERDALQKRLDEAGPLPDPIDVEQVRAKLAQGRETNAVAQNAARREDLNEAARQAEEVSATLTKRMEDRDAEKQSAIAAAKMPVEGLGFSGETVTFNGLPFDQSSTSQQLRVGMCLAAALNPKLRIAFIHDGSLLDQDAMRWLEEFCDANDLQVWTERVDGSGSVGFVIEGGRLKDDDAEVEEAV